jgi:hypothetical protein
MLRPSYKLLCDGTSKYGILIYVQQDATLHSLFYLETALHVSGGNTIHHQERKQLYLQHLVFVTPLLLPAAIARPPPQTSSQGTRKVNQNCMNQMVA